MAIQRQTATSQMDVSASGTRVPASWTLTASSRVNALARMRSAGVFYGAVYREIDNSVPDPFLVCTQILVAPYQGCPEGLSDSVYQVDAVYSPINVSVADNSVIIQVNGPAVWTMEEGLGSIAIDLDKTGSPIVNTAYTPIEGEQIPDPVEYQIAEWIRTGKNYFTEARWARQYRGKTNSATWKGADRREILCHGIKVEALDNFAFGGSGSVKYTAKFEFRSSRPTPAGSTIVVPTGQAARPFREVQLTSIPGFSRLLLSQGVLELNPDYDKDSVDPRRKSKWRPITMLDSDGRKAAIGTPVLLNSSGIYERDDSRRKPCYILYENILETDLNTLRI